MLIGFTGYAQSGKTTCAEYLTETFGFKQVGFADKLREYVEQVNPIIQFGYDPRNGLWGLKYNEALRRYGYEEAKRVKPGFRKALIDFGNGARDIFGEDFWVDQLWKTFQVNEDYAFQDVRFLSEAKRIQKYGDGIIIRINRPSVGRGSNDVSETEMEQINADYTIENNLSKDILLQNVHYYVSKHVRL